jgi:transposase-like protein
MDLLEVEQNLSMVVHCPNCSNSYEVQDAEGNRNDYPQLCKRCASPMNYKDALKFSEAQAVEQAKNNGFSQTASRK